MPVTLVTAGNRFIKTALSLLPGIVLTEQDTGAPVPGAAAAGATPGAGTPQPTPTTQPTAAPAGAGEPALIIYDNTIPDVLPANGSLLFIAPPRSTEYFTTTGLVENPTARVIDPADPLLQNLLLNEVSILDAVQIPLPDWATPVVSGDLPIGRHGGSKHPADLPRGSKRAAHCRAGL